MPVMFDPNGQMPDFATQTAELAKQQALATALRKRADASKAPQGEMVSGYYVNPSWTQQIAPIFDQYQAGQAERAAESGKVGLATAASKASAAWLPQAIAAAQGTPEQSGPPDPTTGSPELQAQPGDRTNVLKMALEGAKIPNNEKAASAYLTTAEAGIKSQEDKAFQSKEALAKRLEAHQQWTEKLKEQARQADEKAADKRVADADRVAAQREANATRALLAQGNQAMTAMRMQLAQDKFNETEPAGQAKERQTYQTNAQKADQRVRDIQQAIALIPKSAGSYGGTVLTKGLDAAGIPTEKSSAAKELETLQGNLLANGFRYPGSTSTYEAKMYKGALGGLADTTIPVETRVAAAQRVLKMAQDEAKMHRNHALQFNARIRPGRPTVDVPDATYDSTTPAVPDSAVPRGNGGAGAVGTALPDGWSFK